jgi:hypothetical protein
MYPIEDSFYVLNRPLATHGLYNLQGTREQ